MKKTRFFFLLPVFFLLISVLSFQAYAGAGIIAGPTGVNANSNTCVMTTSANTNIITGDLAVVVSSVAGLATTISSVSDSGGLFTFTKIVSSGSFNNVTMFSAISTGSAATDAITITYSGNVLNRCQGYFIRGALSATPNQTDTKGATSVTNTITTEVTSFTPTTGDYVLASAMVQTTAGAESAASQAPSSPFSVLTGIQGASGTSYHSSVWQSPSWISGSTTAANTFTITGATALRYDMVIATFWTGPKTTTTSLTATTTTTTAFSTTLTNTVTSTSYSPTVTSTHNVTNTLTSTSTVTSTSYSPTVTSTQNVTNTLTATNTVTSTSYSPTVTSTSFSPTVTSTFSTTTTSLSVTTTTNIFNTTTTFDVFNQTSTVSVTQTQVTIPEPEGSTDILLIFLVIGIALIMFVVGIRYRKAFVTLMGATVLFLLEVGLMTNPLIVYGSNQFPMPLWLLEVIGLFVVVGFMFVLYQVLKSRRF